jgi:hypothetical protein
VRGEHEYGAIAAVRGDGSSPRARGTHSGAPMSNQLPRVIPACAGNTAPNSSTASGSSGSSPRARGTPPRPAGLVLMVPGHPRVRGEHLQWRYARFEWCGSSPRARGTLEMHSAFPAHSRVIPACAGNTF